ncbi:MAG: alpha/beta hydrolase [Lachnospiraceae bacterium]|nr:alpha/beta hydrolase [Lachnospiraceae bacterium]
MFTKTIDLRVEGSQEYASMDVYILDRYDVIAMQERPLVIVCPGGGYEYTSPREGEMIALQFAAKGYHAAVVHYSCAPSVFPTANYELGKAFIYLRKQAAKWHIDPDKIVPIGFSAGGHMVASYCMFWKKEYMAAALDCDSEELRPNGMMLGYPVITSGEYAHRGSIQNLLGEKCEDEEMLHLVSLEYQVNEDVPRTFLWGTYEDRSVPVQNSLYLLNALVAKGIPVEYHLYEKGEHGLSLGNKTTSHDGVNQIVPSMQSWIDRALDWMDRIGSTS